MSNKILFKTNITALRNGDDHEKSGLLESARMNIEGELHNQKV